MSIVNTSKDKKLTSREKEVLFWAANGKTAWETSIILNISKSTVISHLRNSRIKLETVNVVQTIVEAMRRSEIPLCSSFPQRPANGR
ncbi:helix-turn-helix domain-containing protein [Agrobacterium deltaense]|nr:helix-turn-helix domain-containing protein [Agrobacterium deltaense]